MILDSQWIFSDGQAMPNAARAGCSGAGGYSGYIDWTTSKFKDWFNTHIPLWIICTCNTVPGAGTSIQLEFYQHSGTTVADGDLLMACRAIAVADLSTDPYDRGHYIACVPLISILGSVQDADMDRYFGPVLNGAGNVSTGKVDCWLHMGITPPIYVAPPTASNVVMPA